MDLQGLMTVLGRDAAFLGIALGLLWIAKRVKDAMTPFDDSEEIENKDNVAYMLARAGLYVAIIGGMMGSLSGGGLDNPTETMKAFVFEGVFLAAMALVGQSLVRKLIIPGVRMRDAVANQNVAAGIIEFAIAVSIGLIGFGAFSGEGGGLINGVAFTILGVVALVAMILFVEAVTKGKVEAIREGNVPAALILGSKVVSCAILLQMAINGPSEGWIVDLRNVGIWLAIGAVFNLAAAYLVDVLFLPKSRKADWIQNNRVAPAGMQAIVQIALAALVAALL